MKNKYNYIAARETIEQENEKELDLLKKCMQSWGMSEDYIKEAITRTIENIMQMKFTEVNGELRRN